MAELKLKIQDFLAIFSIFSGFEYGRIKHQKLHKICVFLIYTLFLGTASEADSGQEQSGDGKNEMKVCIFFEWDIKVTQW